MKLRTIALTVAVLLVAAIPVQAQPAMGYWPQSVDFGEVEIRDMELETIFITNMGDENLTVQASVAGDAFTLYSGSEIEIAPSDSGGFFTVAFSPFIPGDYTGTLTLMSNDPDNETVNIPLSGTGYQPGYGNLTVNVVDEVENPIENATVMVYLSNQVIAAMQTDEFGVAAFTDLPERTYTVRVEAAGYWAQTVTATVVADGTTEITVQLSEAPDQPMIYVWDEVVDFGTVAVGFTQHAWVGIENHGNQTLVVDLTISGEGFDVVGPTHFMIPPVDSSFWAYLSFSPTHVGEHNGTLTISSNDPENPEIALPLVGQGIEAGSGNVAGVVLEPNPTGNIPVPYATVRLDFVRGPGGNNGPHLTESTDVHGEFYFADIPQGDYSISASIPGSGFATEIISVGPDQTTNVVLLLNEPMPGDTIFGTIELSGTAMVVEAQGDREEDWYFIDVNGDGEPDYQLAFGPAWYEPPSDAERPVDGDHIEIVGGLISYGDPPLVVVYMINGLAWLNTPGHGGHSGGRFMVFGCDPQAIIWTEMEGTAIGYQVAGIMLNAIDTDGNEIADFILDYGDDYNPVEDILPEFGEEIHIVGGLVDCDYTEDWDFLPPWVIVYEINGSVWRVPGDTTGLGGAAIFDSSQSASDLPAQASDYLIVTNYPNPFNPSTTIEFETPHSGQIQVVIYDVVGRAVETITRDYSVAGRHSVEWNGSAQPSGIYFFRVTAGDQKAAGRMLLLK